MPLADKIKSNPRLKALALWLLSSPTRQEPRWWIKYLVNPFKHHRGKKSVIKRARLDLMPYNAFSLGNGSVIEDYATINNAVGAVTIGNESFVGISNIIIGPVSIGNNVILAQHIVASGLNHGYEDVSIPPSKQKVGTSPITINDNVWVGANCVITAGVTIGKHSVIGAGSVVTKNIPDYCVAVGNPARVVKRYNAQTQIWEKV